MSGAETRSGHYAWDLQNSAPTGMQGWLRRLQGQPPTRAIDGASAHPLASIKHARPVDRMPKVSPASANKVRGGAAGRSRGVGSSEELRLTLTLLAASDSEGGADGEPGLAESISAMSGSATMREITIRKRSISGTLREDAVYGTQTQLLGLVR